MGGTVSTAWTASSTRYANSGAASHAEHADRGTRQDDARRARRRPECVARPFADARLPAARGWAAQGDLRADARPPEDHAQRHHRARRRAAQRRPQTQGACHATDGRQVARVGRRTQVAHEADPHGDRLPLRGCFDGVLHGERRHRPHLLQPGEQRLPPRGRRTPGDDDLPRARQRLPALRALQRGQRRGRRHPAGPDERRRAPTARTAAAASACSRCSSRKCRRPVRVSGSRWWRISWRERSGCETARKRCANATSARRWRGRSSACGSTGRWPRTTCRRSSTITTGPTKA